jgi:hypothetical protein
VAPTHNLSVLFRTDRPSPTEPKFGPDEFWAANIIGIDNDVAGDCWP